MIKRYEKCWGLSFPAIGRYKVEAWFAPAGYEIKPHTHNNVDIKLMFLFGNNVLFRRKKKGEFLGETFLARFKNCGRVFNIRAGDEHSFCVSSWPLIFINFESWHIKPTSACEDLQPT